MYADETGSLREPTVRARMRSLSKDELRSCIRDWTLTLKEDGLPPEKVLLTIKALVRETVVPEISRYDGATVVDHGTTLLEDASQFCIEAYFDESLVELASAREAGTDNVRTRKSFARQLLLKLFELQPELPKTTVASRLSISVSQLAAFASGAEPMPLDVQAQLAALIISREPRLARLGHRLRLQSEAARRYSNGEVTRHLTSPPRMF